MSAAIHKLNMLPADAEPGAVRVTYCRRESNGGGIVVDRRGPIFTFSSARGEFLGTEADDLVTCKRCLR